MHILKDIRFEDLINKNLNDKHILMIEYINEKGKNNKKLFKRNDTIYLDNIKELIKSRVGYDHAWKDVTNIINKKLKTNNNYINNKVIFYGDDLEIISNLDNNILIICETTKTFNIINSSKNKIKVSNDNFNEIINIIKSGKLIISNNLIVRSICYTNKLLHINSGYVKLLNNNTLQNIINLNQYNKNCQINYWISSLMKLREIYPLQKLIPYVVHNSLPYESRGYASRTFNILKTFNSMYDDKKYFGLYRITYPYCDNKNLLNETDYLHDVDGVMNLALPNVDCEIYDSFLKIITDIFNIKTFHTASAWKNALPIINFCRKNNLKSIYEIRGLWQVTGRSRFLYYKKKMDSKCDKNFKLYDLKEIESINKSTITLFITKQIYQHYKSKIDKPEIIFPNCYTFSKNRLSFEKFNKPKDKFIIGYAGSVVFYEGIIELIQYIENVINEDIIKIPIEFHLIGNIDTLILEYKRFKHIDIKSIFKLPFVKLLGFVPHNVINDEIKKFDLYVIPRVDLPLTNIVSPIKPFEPMSLGIPLLMSDCDALKDISENGKNCMLYKKNNYDDFSFKLKKIIEEGYPKEIIENGYNYIKNERNWQNIIQRIKLYNMI